MRWSIFSKTLPLFAAALAGCAAEPKGSSSGTAAVIGADDRWPMVDWKMPFTPIGRLETDRGWCTGVLFSPSMLLTNAHCVVDEDENDVSGIVFVPHKMEGADRPRVAGTFVEVGTRRYRTAWGKDWAIIRLDQPLGREYGWLGVRPFNGSMLGQSLALVGYSRDFHGGSTAGIDDRNCRIVGAVGGVDGESGQHIEHQCDQTPGASGGPIIGIFDNAAWIVALNSGTRDADNGGYLNFGVSSLNFLPAVQRHGDW
jgi:protease YdgD